MNANAPFLLLGAALLLAAYVGAEWLLVALGAVVGVRVLLAGAFAARA